MKSTVGFILALAALAAGASGQLLDSCRAFVWDNDAGEPTQWYTSVDMDTSEYCYYAWADRRFGKWDIFMQRHYVPSNIFDSTNILVNYDQNDNLAKTDPDIACDTAGNFVVAWRQNNRSIYYDISCRRFDKYGNPLQSGQTKVSKSADSYYKDWPRVARNKTKYSTSLYIAYFVVVWHEVRGTSHYIYAQLYGSTGSPIGDTLQINDNSSGNAWHPDVAFNDSLIVVTWADNRGGHYDIYARNYRCMSTGMQVRGASYKVNDDTGNMNQDYPAIAMACTTGQHRYWVIAWQDSRDYSSNVFADIYCQQYDYAGATYGFQKEVTPTYSTYASRMPAVAKGRNSFSFIVTWKDSSNYGWRIKARFADTRYTLGTIHEVNDSKELPGKHFPSACYSVNEMVVAFLDSSRTKCRGDVFAQMFSIYYNPTIGDTLQRREPNFKVNSGDIIRTNGRTGWYHYPDYDNPATAWDENPRPIGAPDSVLMPLDSTYVRAILSRNITPGRYYFRVVDTDTFLAGRKQKGNINEAEYDVCVMDLGYANSDFSAGSITDDQMDSLKRFSDSGGALLAVGNDFGEMYDGTSLFGQYFGADYLGPGNDATTGNIDSLVGMPDAFTKGMNFEYPFQKVEDNSVDIIAPLRVGCDTVFMSGGPAKWSYCRGISYSAFWKDPKAADRRNVYLPFVMSALTSDGRHPNTTTELTRRILGFQGFNVEPEPIADLTADTTTSTIEGTVTLRWTAVSDDSLAERASDYLLKIREYNPALPEAGKTTSEQEFLDSGQVYYQAWTPAAVGAAESKTLYLAPGKSYVFALKAGDDSSPVRWSALGAEPMIKSRGDTLTYHYVYMGSSYGLGTVNPFTESERIGVRSSDTLFVTWSSTTLTFGYARMNWLTGGDLFFYMDTKAGGADSTMTDWNGASVDTASAFDVAGDFKPDFCLAIDSLGSKCKLMYWNGTAWAESIGTYPASNLSLDTINDTYTTAARVLRSKIGNPASLKLLVLHLREYDDYCYRSFPPDNPIGYKGAKWIPRYPWYYYFGSLAAGLSPRNTAQSLAVELAEFSALESGAGVTLNWRTESETDNYQWLIDRSLQAGQGYQRLAAVPGQGNSPTGHSYSYMDNAVLPGTTYYYLLGDQDFDENITWHGPVSVTVGGAPVDRVALGPCLPNPARGSSSICYQLPASGRVTLRIYDICGRLVRTLADGEHQPGSYSAAWDGADETGRPAASGVYFFRLETGGTSLTGKLTLIR